MKGSQFPFGQLDLPTDEAKKTFIRKRYTYKNFGEAARIREKIETLKSLSHKNTINLRSAEDLGEGFIDLYYAYVPTPLEECFNANPAQTVKDLHRQFI
jgi:hypothetical protein